MFVVVVYATGRTSQPGDHTLSWSYITDIDDLAYSIMTAIRLIIIGKITADFLQQRGCSMFAYISSSDSCVFFCLGHTQSEATSAFLAVRVSEGRCSVAKASGVFFWPAAQGYWNITTDFGKM